MKFIILQFALQFTIKDALDNADEQMHEYIYEKLESCGSPYSISSGSSYFEDASDDQYSFEVTILVTDPTETVIDDFKTYLQNNLKDNGSPFAIECIMSDIVEGKGGFEAEFTEFNNESNWVKGVVKREDGTIISAFNVKLFDEPSEYGFLNGKGSKIDLRPSGGHFGDCFAHFDRNFWDVMPKEGVEFQQLFAVYELCEASPKRFE